MTENATSVVGFIVIDGAKPDGIPDPRRDDSCLTQTLARLAGGPLKIDKSNSVAARWTNQGIHLAAGQEDSSGPVVRSEYPPPNVCPLQSVLQSADVRQLRAELTAEYGALKARLAATRSYHMPG